MYNIKAHEGLFNKFKESAKNFEALKNIIQNDHIITEDQLNEWFRKHENIIASMNRLKNRVLCEAVAGKIQ